MSSNELHAIMVVIRGYYIVALQCRRKTVKAGIGTQVDNFTERQMQKQLVDSIMLIG